MHDIKEIDQNLLSNNSNPETSKLNYHTKQSLHLNPVQFGS